MSCNATHGEEAPRPTEQLAQAVKVMLILADYADGRREFAEVLAKSLQAISDFIDAEAVSVRFYHMGDHLAPALEKHYVKRRGAGQETVGQTAAASLPLHLGEKEIGRMDIQFAPVDRRLNAREEELLLSMGRLLAKIRRPRKEKGLPTHLDLQGAVKEDPPTFATPRGTTSVYREQDRDEPSPPYKAILEAVGAGVIGVNGQGSITYINPAAAKMFGCRPRQMLGAAAHPFLHQVDGQTRCTRENCPLHVPLHRKASLYSRDGLFWRRDGSSFPVEFMSTPVLKDNRAVGVAVVFKDISGRKHLERRQARLVTIIEESPEFITTADARGNIVYRNRASRRLRGPVQRGDGAKTHLSASHPAWAARLVKETGLPTAVQKGVWTGETAFIDGEGQEIPVLQTIVAHKNEQGEVEYFSTIAVDIREQKRYEARLARLAAHDPLTGLLNRAQFEEKLTRYLQAAADGNHALLYMDIDSFKTINDTYGHRTGDMLLRQFSRFLRENFPRSAFLARLGGDEFGVFLPDTAAARAGEKAKQFLQGLAGQVVTGETGVFRLTVSIGAAQFPRHGKTLGELLAGADAAMYEVKRGGGNGVALFSQNIKAGKEVLSRVRWEQRVRAAVQEERLLLYRQPIIYLPTGEVVGYELLLRMRDDEGGIVGPKSFLAAALRAGLMQEVDLWVVGQAVALLAQGAARDRRCRLAVNLSGQSLTNAQFVAKAVDKIKAAAVDGTDLIFEITEQVSIENVDLARRHMERLQSLGCQFALDDFGVGHANLDLLCRLPVEFVKIDGSFVQNLPARRQNQQLLQLIAQTAASLGKEAIAEFVEDGGTADLLLQFGVNFGQGYHFGRPEPVPD